ncbi:MAG: hypothetical protein IPJ48_11530 [Propionivibrio sp.]|uniref:Uncharacterized protein n=1 Tax=Candidatus Propionivibrio dominans TaxID=2954373 RepID=A0A9D7F7R1_9RHOO|nr:hypothetical protein [Candidatus Propionivibrio dominans]
MEHFRLQPVLPEFSPTTADTQTGGSNANHAGLSRHRRPSGHGSAGQVAGRQRIGLDRSLLTAPSLAIPLPAQETTDQVRFCPLRQLAGTPGQLTVRLIDASSGSQ